MGQDWEIKTILLGAIITLLSQFTGDKVFPIPTIETGLYALAKSSVIWLSCIYLIYLILLALRHVKTIKIDLEIFANYVFDLFVFLISIFTVLTVAILIGLKLEVDLHAESGLLMSVLVTIVLLVIFILRKFNSKKKK
ncbi:MAG: hypothetical protein V1644_02605 [Candidatus Micrarchaeota archaeon]